MQRCGYCACLGHHVRPLGLWKVNNLPTRTALVAAKTCLRFGSRAHDYRQEHARSMRLQDENAPRLYVSCATEQIYVVFQWEKLPRHAPVNQNPVFYRQMQFLKQVEPLLPVMHRYPRVLST